MTPPSAPPKGHSANKWKYLIWLYCTIIVPAGKQSPERKRTAAAMTWKSVRRSSCSSPLSRKSQPLTRGGTVKKKRAACHWLETLGRAAPLCRPLIRVYGSGLVAVASFWMDEHHFFFFFLSGSSGAESWRPQAPPADVTSRSWRCRVEPHLLLPPPPVWQRPQAPSFSFFPKLSQSYKLQTESQLASTAGAVKR